ncbi:MAG TPA: hypothetical protein VFS43_45375 [Polyangiaceae bacterium]|nr:hypothetical protein [Polyangiaceae bacterium]
MPKFDEGKLRFDFGERWRVEKWDACSAYAQGISKLSGELDEPGGGVRVEGTKAVDFVGVLDGERLYLCEVKDFRGYRIENDDRQLGGLPLEVGLKVRDTLAGLVGAYARMGAPPWVDEYGQVLARRKHQVHVVVLIAEDDVRPNEPRGKREARDNERLKRVKQKLAWLTTKVWVENPLQQRAMPDLSVESLPGAGQK